MKVFLARAVMLVIGVILLIQLWIFASLAWWRTQPVETTMFMRLDYWTDLKPIQQDWRDYDQISNNFKHAILAAEDAKFIHHHGFDIAGIQDALERNSEKGKIVAGGSTISQQLAKNLFLYNQRSFIRKGQEVIATWMMERMWSKQRILEVYMNSVEFGQNIYGVEASPAMISRMTDKILPIAKEWQNRPLAAKYAIVFMDGIHYNVRQDNAIEGISRSVPSMAAAIVPE